MNIELKLIAPEELDIIVTGEDKKSIDHKAPAPRLFLFPVEGIFIVHENLLVIEISTLTTLQPFRKIGNDNNRKWINDWEKSGGFC